MTIGLDIQTIQAAVMNRLISDSAGSTARAQIGTSSSLTPLLGRTLAVFAVEQLPQVRAIQPAVPPLWVAVERGSASGRARQEMRTIPFDLWCYDLPEHGAWQLEGMAPLLDALYAQQIIASGRTTVDLITNPTLDGALNLLAMRVRVAFSIFR